MLRTGIETIICLSPNFLYVYVYVYVMFLRLRVRRQEWHPARTNLAQTKALVDLCAKTMEIR